MMMIVSNNNVYTIDIDNDDQDNDGSSTDNNSNNKYFCANKINTDNDKNSEDETL